MTIDKLKVESASTAVEPKGKRKLPKATYKMIRPMASQVDVPTGQILYWCDACMTSFLSLGNSEPTQCSKGHRGEDFEQQVS